MADMSLPPGFRFHPSDEELIMYYLKRKALGKRLLLEAIAEVNVYKYSPCDLPDKSCLKNRDLEWFFFCPVARKYASGARLNRATETGFWKSTGKDRTVKHNGRNVGMVKTLIFHQGHTPKGERTDWVIHEYRILDEELAAAGVGQAAYVLLKLFKKNGLGPKNGAQYGAPFNEEVWDTDDDNEDENYSHTLPPFGKNSLSAVANNMTPLFNTSQFEYGSTSTASLLSPDNSPLSASPPQSENLSLAVAPNNCNTVHTSSATLSVPLSESMSLPTVAHNSSVGSLPESGPLTIMSPSNDVAQSVGDVDFDSLLAMLLEDDLPPGPFGSNDVNQFTGEAYMELDDIYAGLDDLTDLEEL